MFICPNKHKKHQHLQSKHGLRQQDCDMFQEQLVKSTTAAQLNKTEDKSLKEHKKNNKKQKESR